VQQSRYIEMIELVMGRKRPMTSSCGHPVGHSVNRCASVSYLPRIFTYRARTQSRRYLMPNCFHKA